MSKGEGPPWRLYGHEGCGRCISAIGGFFSLLEGEPITVRVEAVDHAPAGAPHGEGTPMLEDPDGAVVWAGNFDAEATLRAWAHQRRRALARRPPRPMAVPGVRRQGPSP